MPSSKGFPPRRWYQYKTLVAIFVAAVGAIEAEHIAAARRLIDATQSNVFHLDLLARGKRPGSRSAEGAKVPWFGGFLDSETPAAATVGHPIHRMLVHLREERIGLEEAMSWTQGSGAYKQTTMFYSTVVVVFAKYRIVVHTPNDLRFVRTESRMIHWDIY